MIDLDILRDELDALAARGKHATPSNLVAGDGYYANWISRKYGGKSISELEAMIKGDGIKQVWSYNGETYETLAEAEKAAQKAKVDLKRRVDAIIQNSGYKPNNIGYWLIEDEGPVDYGSSGHRQTLDYFYGSFLDAANYAARLDGFWGYGPGKITKINVVNDPAKKEPSIDFWVKS